MSPNYIQLLKKPCKNRGLTLINNKNGTVTINNKPFDTIKEVEQFISTFKRKDI